MAAQLSGNNTEVTKRHYGAKLHRYRNWHQHQHYQHHCWLAKEDLSFKLAAQDNAHVAPVGERRRMVNAHGARCRAEDEAAERKQHAREIKRREESAAT